MEDETREGSSAGPGFKGLMGFGIRPREWAGGVTRLGARASGEGSLQDEDRDPGAIVEVALLI